MWKYLLPVPNLTSRKYFKRAECRKLLKHLFGFAMYESTEFWDYFRDRPCGTVPEFVCFFDSLSGTCSPYFMKNLVSVLC
jgi:hypothetical protein